MSQRSVISADRWLLLHALLLAGVLFACSAVVGLRAYFFIDEAAFYAQLEALDRGDWSVDRPYAELDDDLEHLPMVRSDVVDGGFAPFAKHPVHVLLADAADDVLGRAGVRALSTLGVLAASVAVAAAVSHRGRTVSLVALWLTALSTPLLFYGQLVVAHALGAGVAALVLWRVLVAVPRRYDPVVVAGLAALGVLLRAEFLLLLASIATVSLAWAVARRRLVGLGRPLAGAIAGALAYMLEPLLLQRWVGAEAAAKSISISVEGGSAGRRDGALVALLQPDYIRPGVLAPLTVMLVTILGAASLYLVARRASDSGLAVVLAGGAALAALLHLTVPDIVPGLIWAFPAMWLALGLRRDDLDERLAKGLQVAALFGASVLATQYRIAGGGVEWGWRYFAIGIPALVPALAVGVISIWRRAHGDPLRRAALVLVSVAFLLVPLSGLLEQRRYLSDTQYFLEQVRSATSDVDFVASFDPSFGRLAYPLALDGRVAPVAASTSAQLFGWLEADGVERVLLVWRSEERPELEILGYRTASETRYISSGYRGVVVERTNTRSPS